MDIILRKYRMVALFVIFFFTILYGSVFSTYACVGRTVYIGYYHGEPEQKIMATILAIYVDERTGTSVKLVELKNRKQGFDYLKRNKVSIIVEYAGKVLEYHGEEKELSVNSADFDSHRSKIGTDLKAIFVATPGFDNLVSRNKGGGYLGKAYIILSKKALSVFPAMPRLLKKLTGKIDNDVMALFIENIENDSPEKETRNFLKKNKLI